MIYSHVEFCSRKETKKSIDIAGSCHCLFFFFVIAEVEKKGKDEMEKKKNCYSRRVEEEETHTTDDATRREQRQAHEFYALSLSGGERERKEERERYSAPARKTCVQAAKLCVCVFVRRVAWGRGRQTTDELTEAEAESRAKSNQRRARNGDTVAYAMYPVAYAGEKQFCGLSPTSSQPSFHP